MKKMFTFFFVVLLAFSLIACGDDEPDPTVDPTVDTTVDPTVDPTPTPVFTNGTGYGLVHGHYVGVIDVTVDEAGLVSDMEVEEYFLPYSFAKVVLPVPAERTAMGYGLVHGHYVGVATVTINPANEVLSADIEEYFLPYSAAKVVVADPLDLPADVLSVVGSRGTSYYAQFFSVDGILFEGTVTGEAPAQSITYSAEGIENIEAWVEDEANAKHYVEAVDAGLVFIANEDGTESDYVMADASASVSMKKSETSYWSGASYPLGWAGNIAAFVEVITGTMLDADLETIAKNDDGYWLVGDLLSGATMTDFKDYYEVAQRAHTNAKAPIIPADVLTVVGARGTSYYAQFVSIDGMLFEGSVSGTAPAQSINYSSLNVANIEEWVELEVNAKRYVEAVEAGLVFIANADGTESDYAMADASAKVNMKKSLSGYWSGSSYPLGWAGNVAEFKTGIIGTELDATLESITKNVDGYWTIGSIVTGATMTDFKDYYEVAQRAYANQEAEVALQPTVGVGYGLVHGHYVGMITVSVGVDGLVTAATVEEYFLPYSAAKVVVADPLDLPADVLSVTGSRGTSYYAKFFSVDGILFEGTVTGEAPAQSITYSAEGIANIEVWVQNAFNAKRYVEAVEAGLVFIANEDGSESDYVMADASASVSMKKSETSYWSGASYPLGWAGNVAELVDVLIGTDVSEDASALAKDVDGFWVVGDVTTGATMTDFKDYYAVAQVAYAYSVLN